MSSFSFSYFCRISFLVSFTSCSYLSILLDNSSLKRWIFSLYFSSWLSMAASKSANFFSDFSLIPAIFSSYTFIVLALEAFSSSICFEKFDSSSVFSLLHFSVISSLSSFIFNLCCFSDSAISCLNASIAFWRDSFKPFNSFSISSVLASSSSWRLTIFSSYSITTALCDSVKVVFSLAHVSSISLFSFLHFSVISSLTSFSCFSWPCFNASISCSSFSMLVLLVSSSRSFSFSIWAILTSYSCCMLVILVS